MHFYYPKKLDVPRWFLWTILTVQFAFNGIIQGFSNCSANEHFDSCDDIAMLRIPVIAFGWRDFYDGNARIINTFGEPGLDNGFPKLSDFCFVGGNTGMAMQFQ